MKSMYRVIERRKNYAQGQEERTFGRPGFAYVIAEPFGQNEQLMRPRGTSIPRKSLSCLLFLFFFWHSARINIYQGEEQQIAEKRYTDSTWRKFRASSRRQSAKFSEDHSNWKKKKKKGKRIAFVDGFSERTRDEKTLLLEQLAPLCSLKVLIKNRDLAQGPLAGAFCKSSIASSLLKEKLA